MDPRHDFIEIRSVALEEKLGSYILCLVMHSIDRTWINLVVVRWWGKKSNMYGCSCLYYSQRTKYLYD